MGLLANILALSACFTTLFLGLPWPIYFFFTSFYSLGHIGHHSCHASSLSLLIYSSDFPGPFTSSLPLIISMALLLHYLGFISPFISSLSFVIFMGLLAINPTTSAQWTYFLISLPFCPSFSFIFLIVELLLLLGPLSIMGINSHLKGVRIMDLTVATPLEIFEV